MFRVLVCEVTYKPGARGGGQATQRATFIREFCKGLDSKLLDIVRVASGSQVVYKPNDLVVRQQRFLDGAGDRDANAIEIHLRPDWGCPVMPALTDAAQPITLELIRQVWTRARDLLGDAARFGKAEFGGLLLNTSLPAQHGAVISLEDGTISQSWGMSCTLVGTRLGGSRRPNAPA